MLQGVMGLSVDRIFRNARTKHMKIKITCIFPPIYKIVAFLENSVCIKLCPHPPQKNPLGHMYNDALKS